MRYAQLVAFGPDLFREAARSGKGVNESYLFVHRVLAEVFREDLSTVSETGLRELLSRKLERQIQASP